MQNAMKPSSHACPLPFQPWTLLDLLLEPLTYAYNAQVHHTTVKTPLTSVLPHEASGPITFVTPTALPTDAKSETKPKALRYHISSCLSEMLYNADKRMEAAQQCYKLYIDAQVR